jgi:hypothetical protein
MRAWVLLVCVLLAACVSAPPTAAPPPPITTEVLAHGECRVSVPDVARLAYPELPADAPPEVAVVTCKAALETCRAEAASCRDALAVVKLQNGELAQPPPS